MNVQNWASQVCYIMIETSINHWKERNHQLHNGLTERKYIQDELQSTILEIQNNKMHQTEQGIEEYTKRNNNPKSPQNMIIWIQTLKNAMEFTKKMTHKIGKNQTKLSKYFTRLSG